MTLTHKEDWNFEETAKMLVQNFQDKLQEFQKPMNKEQYAKQLEALKQIISRGEKHKIHSSKDKEGTPLVFLAIEHGLIDLGIAMLLKGNAKLADRQGGNVLHFICSNRGLLSIIQHTPQGTKPEEWFESIINRIFTSLETSPQSGIGQQLITGKNSDGDTPLQSLATSTRVESDEAKKSGVRPSDITNTAITAIKVFISYAQKYNKYTLMLKAGNPKTQHSFLGTWIAKCPDTALLNIFLDSNEAIISDLIARQSTDKKSRELLSSIREVFVPAKAYRGKIRGLVESALTEEDPALCAEKLETVVQRGISTSDTKGKHALCAASDLGNMDIMKKFTPEQASMTEDLPKTLSKVEPLPPGTQVTPMHRTDPTRRVKPRNTQPQTNTPNQPEEVQPAVLPMANIPYYSTEDLFEFFAHLVKNPHGIRFQRECFDLITSYSLSEPEAIQEVFQATNVVGDTVLHIAAKEGNVEYAQHILQYLNANHVTISLSQVNKKGNAILHEAVINGNPEIIPHLTEIGCQDFENKDGKTALKLAELEHPNAKAVEYLTEQTQSPRSLKAIELAAMLNNPKTAYEDIVLKIDEHKGLPKYEYQSDHRTVLQRVLKAGLGDPAVKLATAGVLDPNIRSSVDKTTASHTALGESTPKVAVAWASSSIMDWKATDENGLTPVQYAIQRQRGDVLAALDQNIRQTKAEHSQWSTSEAVRLIVVATGSPGADSPEAKAKPKGFHLEEKEAIRLLQILKNHNVQLKELINTTDSNGENLSHVLIGYNGPASVLKYLNSLGLNSNQKNHKNNTPFQLACAKYKGSRLTELSKAINHTNWQKSSSPETNERPQLKPKRVGTPISSSALPRTSGLSPHAPLRHKRSPLKSLGSITERAEGLEIKVLSSQNTRAVQPAKLSPETENAKPDTLSMKPKPTKPNPTPIAKKPEPQATQKIEKKVTLEPVAESVKPAVKATKPTTKKQSTTRASSRASTSSRRTPAARPKSKTPTKTKSGTSSKSSKTLSRTPSRTSPETTRSKTHTPVKPKPQSSSLRAGKASQKRSILNLSKTTLQEKSTYKTALTAKVQPPADLSVTANTLVPQTSAEAQKPVIQLNIPGSKSSTKVASATRVSKLTPQQTKAKGKGKPKGKTASPSGHGTKYKGNAKGV